MAPSIVCQGVWKRFHRGERHDSLRDLIPALARRVGGRSTPVSALGEGDFWAVQDVTFTVEPGRALGIIGPNGAGKSTMLKMLTRILRPTRGAVALRGRVASMIEVAGGFHGDLTGRENIFLQGAIMGLRRREIIARLDSIVEFAGVGEFIDTQVKRYSNGMNARLGFAIAAHLDPDVLVIDEVLSVGDMAFQEKCLVRMKSFKENGVAIVFVSHNLQAVTNLCDEAVFLQSSVKAQGNVLDTIGAYLHATQAEGASERSGVYIDQVRLLDENGGPAGAVAPGAALILEARYTIREALLKPTFGLTVIRSTDHLVVFDGHFPPREMGIRDLGAGHTYLVRFALRANLTRGPYHIGLDVNENSIRWVGYKRPAAFFQIADRHPHGGIVDLGVTVDVTEQNGAGTTSRPGPLQRVDGR